MPNLTQRNNSHSTLPARKVSTTKSAKSKKGATIDQSDDGISHKLLMDMAKKYRNVESDQRKGIHRNQLLDDLQSLAQTLLKSEKKWAK